MWGRKATFSRTHLGQVPQTGPLPPQLVQDAAVEGFLLLAAMAQLRQVGVIQAGPVFREGLGTVALDLPVEEERGQRFQSKHCWQIETRCPFYSLVAVSRLIQFLQSDESVTQVLLKSVWQGPEAAQVPAAITTLLKSFSN